MTSSAFLTASPSVSWTRQVLMLKARFVIVVGRPGKRRDSRLRWLFSLRTTTLRADESQKRLVTGFDDRNLLLAPFRPEIFSGWMLWSAISTIVGAIFCHRLVTTRRVRVTWRRYFSLHE